MKLNVPSAVRAHVYLRCISAANMPGLAASNANANAKSEICICACMLASVMYASIWPTCVSVYVCAVSAACVLSCCALIRARRAYNN